MTLPSPPNRSSADRDRNGAGAWPPASESAPLRHLPSQCCHARFRWAHMLRRLLHSGWLLAGWLAGWQLLILSLA